MFNKHKVAYRKKRKKDRGQKYLKEKLIKKFLFGSLSHYWFNNICYKLFLRNNTFYPFSSEVIFIPSVEFLKYPLYHTSNLFWNAIESKALGIFMNF